MPRPMNRTQEKSKDFMGSMKILFKNLNPWKYLISLALILACVSAIFSIIAPNKLSDLTDTISSGLVPKTKKLTTISEKISSNLTEDKLSGKIPLVMSSSDLTQEEKEEFTTILEKMQVTKDKDEQIKLFSSIPDSVLKLLLEDIEVENTKITVNDQMELLKLVTNLNGETKTENALNIIDKLPKSVYKLVEPKMDIDKVKKIAIFMATLYILSAIFSYIESFAMATVSNNFARNLRERIIKKINKLPLKYFDTHENGDILSRITNDVDTVSQNLNQSLSTLVASVTLFIGSIIMMFVTNWIMALTAIVSSLIGFSLMILILNKSQKYFNERQTKLGDINGYIEEMYSGHSVVKTYNGIDSAIADYEELNDKLYDANRKSQFLSGLMQPIMSFVGNFGYVAVCIVGALLALNGHITFGVIVAFMVYVRLFTNPLSQIAQAMTSLQSTAAASERVFEFLGVSEMSDESHLTKHLDNSKVKGNIEFKNVKFGYDENRIIINNFSAMVKPGQKIAIVGPTGAGKTTMVNLLMKFYEVNSGDILIDGTSINDLTRDNIHRLFCMVLQDTWLFEDTIKNNIRFNNEEISDEAIWESCRTVGVDHFIKTLPQGIDTKITDTDTISSGQKQLFTIARGMLEDAPFLILDEATSNVDTRTEELVQRAMDKLTEGRTSFIIAHRLSTIKNADLILVMKDGNIIESGSHVELMNKKGFYADLYNSQFELQ